ncbi:hypothetical protein ABGC77_003602 [Escherichia coli]|nr:hypothetical protein [Escherichia coli]EKQ8160685.1 hypothetical protein [Escherichia coli]ELC3370319.1 hypothetical protein [Escherichia coli]HEA8924662.1 hypothetical protein [Escherichia coli]
MVQLVDLARCISF